jgi:hypothetical protein
MNRAIVAAALATLAFAPAASAAPIGLRHDRDATAVALAGPDVLVLSEDDERVRLVALPRAGGPARTLLSVRDSDLSSGEDRLAASAERVAVIVEMEGAGKRPDEHRVYSGPPSGPLALVRRTPDPDGEAFTPYVVSVDGDRLLLVEGIATSTTDEEPTDAGPVRAQILDASGWTPVAWATSKRIPFAIAGPYAAVAAYDPLRVELVDLATGTPLGSLRDEEFEVLAYDLAADGRLAVATPGQIRIIAPGQPTRSLPDAKGLGSPRFAGGSLVAFNRDTHRLDLFGADGTRSSLGPPSMIHTDVEADEGGAAWLFNGCVRYAPLDGSASPAGRDSCPASEVGLYGIAPSSKLRGNRARVPVRCVHAARGRCRGRLVVRLDYDAPIVARGRFDIPVGDRWVNVTVRFNRRTVAKLTREGRGSAIVNAIVRDGTVGSGADYSAEFGITVDDRSQRSRKRLTLARKPGEP